MKQRLKVTNLSPYKIFSRSRLQWKVAYFIEADSVQIMKAPHYAVLAISLLLWSVIGTYFIDNVLTKTVLRNLVEVIEWKGKIEES